MAFDRRVNKPVSFLPSVSRQAAGRLLATLISDDSRFRDVNQGLDAYAEAWADLFPYPPVSRQYVAISSNSPEIAPWSGTTLSPARPIQAVFWRRSPKLNAEFIRMQRVASGR